MTTLSIIKRLAVKSISEAEIRPDNVPETRKAPKTEPKKDKSGKIILGDKPETVDFEPEMDDITNLATIKQ